MKKQLLQLTLLLTLLASPLFGKSAYQYKVQFEGTDNKSVIKALENYSEIYRKRDKPPTSLASFQKRVQEDSKLMINVLHSLGYYDGQVSLVIDSSKQGFNISVNIHTGKMYHINSFRLIPSLDYINLKDIDINLGMPAGAEHVLQAEKKLISLLKNKGYLTAKIQKKNYLVDQKKKQLNGTLYVSTGPKYYFGKTSVTGLKNVEKTYIDQRIAWKEGDIFSPRVQQRTLDNLEAGGLFNIVDITFPLPPPKDHILPMKIRVVEGKQRTISTGVSYTLDEGFGVSLGWKHRNTLGMGELFSFESSFSKQDYSFSGSYRIPYFLGKGDQDLIWTLQRDKETTTAYVERSSSLSAIIEKKFSSSFFFSYGGKILSLNTTRAVDTGSYELFSVPILAKFSHLNNPLQPSKGWLASYQAFPYKNLRGKSVAFVTQKIKAKIYYPLFKEKFIVTSSGVIGAILGSDQPKIPTPLRLYAGSFQELPGYKYNSVSPLGPDNKPIGGLSELIFSLAGTLKFTENLGATLGYAAGNVYSTRYIKLKERFLKSWYMGGSYFTAIGPLDLVLAFPLDRRKGIDSAFQFYINLGNTF